MGYSEFDEGDEGNPWWESNERIADALVGKAGVSTRKSYQAVLIAIQHNSKHAQGPSAQQRHYCQQAATKITKNIVDYVENECNNDERCSGVCIKRVRKIGRKNRNAKDRCRGAMSTPFNTIFENDEE